MQPVFESVETFTIEEFERFVDEREAQGDIHHYELLHGRIVMNPPAGWPHGLSEGRFVSRLEVFVSQRQLGYVFGSSQGFVFPSGDVVEPDGSFVSQARWKAAPAPEEGKFLRVVPDLIAEIVSPGKLWRDRGEKLGIYERNHVLEYWLIEPLPRRITVWNAGPEGRFAAPRTAGADEPISSAILEGLTVRLSDLLST